MACFFNCLKKMIMAFTFFKIKYMKYMAYYNKQFYEFSNWGDLEYFLIDKPNTPFRKITSDKKEAEFRSMYSGKDNPLNKIYVVIADDQVYRFDKWKDCKQFLSERPSITKYRSFTNEEEAQDFVNKNLHKFLTDIDDTLYCFINPSLVSASSGEDDDAYKLVRNNVTEKVVPIGKLVKSDFTTRELSCVIMAVKRAIEDKEERIVIAYQNPGVEMWANGSWQARKEITKNYKKEIEQLRKLINIDFIDAN